MIGEEQRQWIAGLRVTSLGILTGRVLGMLRDMAMAALWGVSGGGVMDAFVLAYRIPNLLRRTFGEGAFSAAYLPAFSAAWEQDRREAWRLASAVLAISAGILGLILLVGEAICAAILFGSEQSAASRLVVGLTAAMMPLVVLVCLTAQMSATLHALGRFSVPAMAPVCMNCLWLAAAWFVAPLVSTNKVVQAYVLAGAVVLGGAVQLAVQLPTLRRMGAQFDLNLSASRARLWTIGRSMVPLVPGLAATQINTLMDSLLAWSLTKREAVDTTIAWLGHAVSYPLRPGATAALYCAERLYQFPQGLLGVAVATVIFPLLSRHAAQGHRERLGRDMTLGLRLVLFCAVPASAGLMLLGEPIARLLFDHGAATAEDTLRTGRLIAAYGIGVWAYCAIPVVVRGFYATGNLSTPLKLSLSAIALNLVLNISLVWMLAEVGFAVATATSAALQSIALTWLFSRRISSIDWRPLSRTALRTAAATAAMLLVAWIAREGALSISGFAGTLLSVVVPLAAGVLAYLVAAWRLKLDELPLLLGRWNTLPVRRPELSS